MEAVCGGVIARNFALGVTVQHFYDSHDFGWYSMISKDSPQGVPVDAVKSFGEVCEIYVQGAICK